MNSPGACQKMVALPLYKPQKGADQGKEGLGQSLVDLGTVSHGLMDRGNFCQDVQSAPDEHCQDVENAKLHLVHLRPDDIQKIKKCKD